MARQGSYGIEIVVGGVVVPEIEKDGKTYLAAPADRDFSIRITTPSHHRTEVVLSVDGLSVMTGQDASSSERGYVVQGTTDIPGFRLNDREVAAFHFGDRNDSYAAQLGKPKNVGIIAAKFFSEYINQPVYRRRFPMAETLGGTRSRGGHDMGTEFGDRREHEVSSTPFERDREVVTLAIDYASEASLRRRGILPAEPPLGSVNAFPGDQPSGPGCKPPAGWKGAKRPAPRRTMPGRPSVRRSKPSTRRRSG
jgi:hypothetical protein